MSHSRGFWDLKVKDGCNKEVLGSRDSRKPAASLREEALDCESGNDVSDQAVLSTNELSFWARQTLGRSVSVLSTGIAVASGL